MSGTSTSNEPHPSGRVYKGFYSQLRQQSWDNAGEQVLDFLKRHKANLLGKTGSGRPLIQVLIEDAKQYANGDQVVCDAIDLMDNTCNPDESVINQINDKTKKTGLCYAFDRHSIDVIEKLIKKNAKRERDVLHAAIRTRDFDIVKEVLALEPELVNCKNDIGITPLYQAFVVSVKLSIFKLLVEGGGDVFVKDDLGWNFLEEAVRRRRNDIVKWLLGDPEDDKLDSLYIQGNPLYIQGHAERSKIEAVQRKFRMTINDGNPDNNLKTLLMLATSNENVPMVNFLLKHHAKASARDKFGRTALFDAVSTCSPWFVKELLVSQRFQEIRDTINIPCGCGASIFLHAFSCRQFDVMKVLLRHGVELRPAARDLLEPMLHLLPRVYPEQTKMYARGSLSTVFAEISLWPDASTLRRSDECWSVPRALQLAFSGGGEVAAAGLVDNLSIDVKATDTKRRTALHLAAACGNDRFVAFLLEHCSSADYVNAKDDHGWTPLHYASWGNTYELTKAYHEQNHAHDDAIWAKNFESLDHISCAYHLPVPVVPHASSPPRLDHYDSDTQSDDGNDADNEADTASLPANFVSKHVNVINILLDNRGDALLRTNKDETVFHLAASRGHVSRLDALMLKAAIICRDMKLEEILLQEDYKLRTPLSVALIKKKLGVIRLLLESTPISALASSNALEHYHLEWLAQRNTTHELARSIFRKLVLAEAAKSEIGANLKAGLGKDLSVLELASYLCYNHAIWWLLCTSPPSSRRDQDKTSSLRIARVRRPEVFAESESAWSKFQRGEIDIRAVHEAHGRASRLRNTILILEKEIDPLIDPKQQLRRHVEVFVDIPRHPQHLSGLLESFKAQIFHFKDGVFTRNVTTISSLIYGAGPRKVIEDFDATKKDIAMRSNWRSKTSTGLWRPQNDQLVWVHLPANNMRWMEDLAQRMCRDAPTLKCNLEWFRRSYTQITSNRGDKRFMEPNSVCSEEETHDDEKKQLAVKIHDGISLSASHRSNFNSPIAVYMPYLHPAKHYLDEDPVPEMCQKLLDSYTEAPMHASATLDEFFYNSNDAAEVKQAMQERNRDQVLSRVLHGDLDDKKSVILINVEQLWIWVLNEGNASEVIITSETHKNHSLQYSMCDSIVSNMCNTAGEDIDLPRDAIELCELIVRECPNSFSKEHEVVDNHSDGPTQVCIRKAFNTALTTASVQESQVYSQFAGALSNRGKQPHGGKQSHRAGKSPKKEGKPDQILGSAKLFREVKDIRDELRMLKVVTEYQDKAQSELAEILQPRPRQAANCGHLNSAKEVLQTLADMDKTAERIENAVNTTLNLQQNAVGIHQAEEAVRQGRIFMLFTVVTILFVPLSFFTSLFAVQVETFMKTPNWAFIVMFVVSFAISTPLAIYAFRPETDVFWLTSIGKFCKTTWKFYFSGDVRVHKSQLPEENDKDYPEIAKSSDKQGAFLGSMILGIFQRFTRKRQNVNLTDLEAAKATGVQVTTYEVNSRDKGDEAMDVNNPAGPSTAETSSAPMGLNGADGPDSPEGTNNPHGASKIPESSSPQDLSNSLRRRRTGDTDWTTSSGTPRHRSASQ